MAEGAAQGTKPVPGIAGRAPAARQAHGPAEIAHRMFSEPGTAAERRAGARSPRAVITSTSRVPVHPENPPAAARPAPIQRCGIGSSCDCSPHEKLTGIQRDLQRATASGGAPLPGDARRTMERAFGADFAAVRVHTGPGAQDVAAALHARALTAGTDILFYSGAFRPGTPDGDRLLAHELAHVVQQTHGLPQAAVDSGATDPLERAASLAADHASPATAQPSVQPAYAQQDAPAGPVTVRRQAGGAAAQTGRRFTAEGVSVLVRSRCDAPEFGLDTVETATRDALDKIFNGTCIAPDRARQIQRNLTAHGLDLRCRPSATIDGACAESTGFFIPANIITLGSKTFPAHPDVSAGCLPLESTILHEIVHITRGFAGEELPRSCEASCYGVGGTAPDLCLSPIVTPAAGAAPAPPPKNGTITIGALNDPEEAAAERAAAAVISKEADVPGASPVGLDY